MNLKLIDSVGIERIRYSTYQRNTPYVIANTSKTWIQLSDATNSRIRDFNKRGMS